MVNGYAGTEPPGYARVRDAMKDFPTETGLELLRSMDVRIVLVHLRGFGPNRRTSLEERLPPFASQLKEAARFDDDLVFEILPRQGAKPAY